MLICIFYMLLTVTVFVVLIVVQWPIYFSLIDWLEYHNALFLQLGLKVSKKLYCRAEFKCHLQVGGIYIYIFAKQLEPVSSLLNLIYRVTLGVKRCVYVYIDYPLKLEHLQFLKLLSNNLVCESVYIL